MDGHQRGHGGARGDEEHAPLALADANEVMFGLTIVRLADAIVRHVWHGGRFPHDTGCRLPGCPMGAYRLWRHRYCAYVGTVMAWRRDVVFGNPAPTRTLPGFREQRQREKVLLLRAGRPLWEVEEGLVWIWGYLYRFAAERGLHPDAVAAGVRRDLAAALACLR